jgi:anti-sigma regulatory factor (Ser/Thr protein kinase)
MYISTNPMEDGSSLQLIAGVEHLAEIRHYLSSKAAALHIDPSTTYDILLAVTELVTNTLLYGYQEKSGFIEVQMGRQADVLVVHLRDQAEMFDPTKVPPPNTSLPLEKRPLGGMGIYLTRQLVDSFTYQRLPQGENEITLAIDLKKRGNKKDEDDANDR